MQFYPKYGTIDARFFSKTLQVVKRYVQKIEQKQLSFFLPFGGKLDPENRRGKLSEIIPWNVIEEKYAELLPANCGIPAKPLRMALGALIIKEKCGFSDRETVEQIKEKPYLQYFIGLKEFKTEAPFDSSVMVHFRKRLGIDAIIEINELICKTKTEDENDDNHEAQQSDDKNAAQKNDDKSSNKGTLILDAAYAPTRFSFQNLHFLFAKTSRWILIY